MYDNKHRFHILSTNPKKTNRLIQKGIREKLLCEDCEQKLSRWEMSAHELFNNGSATTIEQEGRLLRLSGVDYISFRLFQLSVLWRASISTLEFFSHVSLGNHQESIRRLLISSNPGLPWQYGCVMCALISNEAILVDVMIQPDRLKLQGHTAYRFVFGGFMWIYVVSNHPPPAVIQSAFLHSDGAMTILEKDFESVKYFKHLAIELFEHGKV